MQGAVIFDVDGVLLTLTRNEEDVFFEALAGFVPVSDLSRDWNSYRIRNDDDIISEILSRFGKPTRLKANVKVRYLALLESRIASGALTSVTIPGARVLLEQLSGLHKGIATANLLGAARLRLTQAGLWRHVSATAFGADGGGHKHEILRRALTSLNVTPDRVVYVGDNLNDLEAALKNQVHFIGFSSDAARRRTLAEAGAVLVTDDHQTTRDQIFRHLAA